MPRTKLRARVLRRGRELEVEGALEYPGPPAPGPPDIDSEAIRAAYREGQRWGWWRGTATHSVAIRTLARMER